MSTSIAFVALASTGCSGPDLAVEGASRRLSSGGSHTCAVTSSGAAICWGNDTSGQLGDGTRSHPSSCIQDETCGSQRPVPVSGLTSGVAQVSAGGNHSCAINAAGGVVCWGENRDGELGDGSQHHQGCTPEGDQDFDTDCSLEPVDVKDLPSGASSVSSGFQSTCALTGAGVVCWGALATLVDPSTPPGTCIDVEDAGMPFPCANEPEPVAGLGPDVASISVGDQYACALMRSGGVRCWGSNQFGQLGDGSFTHQDCGGFDCSKTPVEVSGLSSGVAAIAAGISQACALTTAGAIRCWGENRGGELGDGSMDHARCRLENLEVDCSAEPVEVSGFSSGAAEISAGSAICALTTGREVRCWGDVAALDVGQPETAADRTPFPVPNLDADVTAVSAGGEQVCALNAAGDVFCWGFLGFGAPGTVKLVTTL